MIIVSRYSGREDFLPLRTVFEPAAPERVFVDALSGKDGRALWCWHVELPTSKSSQIHAPLWWGRGPDGWPMVALPLGGIEDGQDLASELFAEPIVYMIEASTGRERHKVPGLARAAAADLDGDGLNDLWENSTVSCAFRGERRAWRALGNSIRRVGWNRPIIIPFRHEPVCHRPEIHGFDRLSGKPDGRLRRRRGYRCAVRGMAVPRVDVDITTRSRTVMVRSGRDGRVVSKTGIGPLGSWVDPSIGDGYARARFRCPRAIWTATERPM